MPGTANQGLREWGHGGYHAPMQAHATDPRNVSVQLQLRVPFWYKQQLTKEARKRGANVPALIREVLEEAIPPEPPR